MPLQNATLTFSYPVNASLQIGDIVYYSTITSSGGFATVLPSNTMLFGTATDISADGLSIDVIYEDTTATTPGINDYISFAKDKQINSSSLVGYYAEAKFINNSKEEAKLFSVGSEVSESSK
jgi:hypothetical protein